MLLTTTVKKKQQINWNVTTHQSPHLETTRVEVIWNPKAKLMIFFLRVHYFWFLGSMWKGFAKNLIYFSHSFFSSFVYDKVKDGWGDNRPLPSESPLFLGEKYGNVSVFSIFNCRGAKAISYKYALVSSQLDLQALTVSEFFTFFCCFVFNRAANHQKTLRGLKINIISLFRLLSWLRLLMRDKY